MSTIRATLSAWILASAAVVAPATAPAQTPQERDGVVMHWGFVPAETVYRQHGPAGMHGVTYDRVAHLHHLVVALFTADGRRIDNAVVRGHLSESGVVDSPARIMVPMVVNGRFSYGQFFQTVMHGPYRVHVYVKLPDRADEIVYTVSAQPLLQAGR